MRLLIRLAALLRKELLQLTKNPKMRLSLFIPPMMQLIMLGYAATLDLKRVDYAVLDYSCSAESRELKNRFAGSPVFWPQAELVSPQELGEKIENRKIQLALVIPPDFARSLAGHGQPTVEVIVDGRSANSAGMAQAYAMNIINEFSLNRLGQRGHLKIETRGWYNPNFNIQYFMVPSLLAMIALVDIMLICALAIAREREGGTFDQLRMTPFSSFELLFAKGCSAMFVGICQLSVGTLVALYWFRVPFQSSWLLLIALLASFLGASISIGLFISILCKNLQQALLGLFMVAVPFAMLSGMGTPLESMPDFFQKATIINPLRHGIAALPRLFLEGTHFSELQYSFYFLWTITVVMFTLTYILFSRQRREG